MSQNIRKPEFSKRLRKEQMSVLLDLQINCDAPVRCIYCGKTVMYAQPDPEKDIHLPDMLCLKCKKEKVRT